MTHTMSAAKLPMIVFDARLRRTLVAASLVMLAAGTASAQATDAQAGAGVLFETYKFAAPTLVDLEKVSLVTVPVTASVALSPKIEFGVNGAFASATRTRRGGQSTTISGLTDTDVHLGYRLSGGRVLLTATGYVPTGKTQLTGDQMELTGLIASDLLPFAISNWGSGGGIGLSAALAAPVTNETTVGLSAGYVVGRAYEPLSTGKFAYRPGNQLLVRGSIDRLIGITARTSLQVTYAHFNQDQTIGTNFYQTGDRLQAVGSVAFAAGPQRTGVVYLGFLQRQVGKFTSVVDVTPAQHLLYAGAGVRQPMGRLTLVPSLDVRLLGSEDGVGQGRNISVGVGAEVPFESIEVVPMARARFGKLVIRTLQESTFTGFELGLSIRHRAIFR
ncbi:MAG: hypothetical protein ABI601_20000 [bacterium]